GADVALAPGSDLSLLDGDDASDVFLEIHFRATWRSQCSEAEGAAEAVLDGARSAARAFVDPRLACGLGELGAAPPEDDALRAASFAVSSIEGLASSEKSPALAALARAWRAA